MKMFDAERGMKKFFRPLISRNFDTWNNSRMENYMRRDPISCINIETSHVSTRDRTSLSDKSNNRANICTFLHKSRSHYRKPYYKP